MRHIGIFVGMLCVCVVICVPAMGQGARDSHVGYQVLDFDHPEDTEKLAVAVWYPTEVLPKSYTYGGPTKGQVAVDAAPDVDGGPYPLLVFSHGYGGSGLGAAFLAEALAARGWIVACPDHHDEYSAVRIREQDKDDFDRLGFLRYGKEIASSGPEDRGKYLFRLDELKCALDGMEASKVFGPVIDSNRIAVGGHSFGGFTALGISGTIRERQDSRVKALLLFSTGAGSYLYSDKELSAVRVPTMLFMGSREADQRRGSETMSDLTDRLFESLSGTKYFLEVRGANHFSFSNNLQKNRRGLGGNEREFKAIRRYSIAFLEARVEGSEDAEQVLEQKDRRLTRYLRKLVESE